MMHRSKRRTNFVICQRGIYRDENLSPKARYLMMQCVSLPDDWKYSVSGLSKVTGLGETAVRSCLAELKAQGYLELKRKRKDGKFDYDWDFYEEPKRK